jgi:hypothetical protein
MLGDRELGHGVKKILGVRSPNVPVTLLGCAIGGYFRILTQCLNITGAVLRPIYTHNRSDSSN